MIKIDIENHGIIEAREGDNLYRVLSQAGLMEGPCGGQGTCGKCGVTVDGQQRLSCTFKLSGDVQLTLPQKTAVSGIVAEGYIKGFDRETAAEGELGIIVDIGTTTVVASLVELHTGKERGTLSCLNSQKSFGQDVISRMHYASENEGGTRQLQNGILEDLRALFHGLLEREGVAAGSVKRIVIAGNTTMIHLLAGADTAAMGRSPYVPSFTGPLVISAGELSLPAAPETEVYCIPAVSAFVGGDITSGVLACGLDKGEGNVLFLDIGTNGEIVLKKEDAFFCCSCAAGPALEGMNISSGMRAADGAIEDVWIGEEDVAYQTIGDKPAMGICGSGILAAVAELRRMGVINRGGRLGNHPMIETEAGKKRFALDKDRGLYLTQKDIRQVQLARGAILSGIYALLAQADMGEEAVERVMVAGQFGAHLKPESLIGSGILPEGWADNIHYVGNTSKSGAYICLLSAKERREAEKLSEYMNYIDLSRLEGYEKLFVECLSF